MTINADSIEEYLNTEDIVYISSLPTPEEKESAIFSRITTLPTVQVRVNPGQTENPIKNSIPTYRNLSTDTINNCDLGEKIQIAISEQGGCFNIEDLPEITTIEELLNHLCEVLIRFDTDPNNYLKDDYTILLKTICNSLIHLYLHENEIDYNKASNKPKINNIELVGNKTSQDLSLADANHNHDDLYGTKQEILDLQSQKADKSTTLNGYGITDAYTKTESDDKYETITNVNALRTIVTGHTEAISNKANKSTTLDGYGIPDVPLNNKIYGRKDGNWTLIDTGISDAPIDGTPYSRQDGDWVVAETGIEEAPNDGEVYGRKNSLWEIIPTGGGTGSTISIIWYNLKSLRDNGQLVPGQSYRITDYITTTTQTDTKSVSNQFDIILTALDENTLSENASAVQHDGDTYFTNAKLESWELKYCFDNDTNRFAWADASNGTGVIYYMKDEWNNECPYDFKNIKFKKNGVWLYTFGGTTDDSLTGGCHHNTMMDYVSSSVLTLNFNTFGSGCYSNTFGTECYSNTFGDGCYSNTFGNYCSYNKFGDYCWSNTFGNYCEHNEFGDNCDSNTFGDICDYNTFGDNCYYNTFGDNCYSNVFGDRCQLNTFGNSCQLNTFGNNCNADTFGNYCSSNTFGNSCDSNTFGNSCDSNTFGYNCHSNTFGDDCGSNKFYHGSSGTTPKNYMKFIVLEDGVSYNNFYSKLTTSSSSYLQRIRIKGLENTTATNTTITLSATNTKYEWLICYTSGNVLKQYCPNN